MPDERNYTLVQLAAGTQWNDQRFAWSSGDLIYKGYHLNHGAAEGDDNWVIWKYTWSSGDLLRIEGPLVGAWGSRTALVWG